MDQKVSLNRKNHYYFLLFKQNGDNQRLSPFMVMASTNCVNNQKYSLENRNVNPVEVRAALYEFYHKSEQALLLFQHDTHQSSYSGDDESSADSSSIVV